MEASQTRGKRDFSEFEESSEGANAAPMYKTLRSGRRIKTRPAATPEPSGPTFKRFGSLPLEIRLNIWQLAAEAAMEPYHPLRVRMYKGFEMVKDADEIPRRLSVLRLAAMPDLATVTKARRSLLRVNREANAEAKRLWNHSLPIHPINKGRKLYFSHSYDVIFIDIREQPIVSDLLRLRRMNQLPSFTADIGHVGFEMVPTYPLQMLSHENLHPSIALLFCFPRLHSVSLVHFKSFCPEVRWELASDVRWLLKKSRQHGVNFQSFKALPGFDYNKACSRGNRMTMGTVRHECAICTIHKCAYIISLLRNRSQLLDARHREISEEQAAFLGGLRRFMLLASTPVVAGCFPAYDHHAVGWYNQRSALQGNTLEEEAFAMDSAKQKAEDGVLHHHGHYDDDSSDDEEGQGDEDDEDDEEGEGDDVGLAEPLDLGDLENGPLDMNGEMEITDEQLSAFLANNNISPDGDFLEWAM